MDFIIYIMHAHIQLNSDKYLLVYMSPEYCSSDKAKDLLVKLEKNGMSAKIALCNLSLHPFNSHLFSVLTSCITREWTWHGMAWRK